MPVTTDPGSHVVVVPKADDDVTGTARYSQYDRLYRVWRWNVLARSGLVELHPLLRAGDR